MRLLIGFLLVVLTTTAIWLAPWQSIRAALPSSDDELPAWIPADGHSYPSVTYPELYRVLKTEHLADGPSFKAPDFTEEHDFLANDRFGSRSIYRCIATRKLEDRTPAGTLGWCEPNR